MWADLFNECAEAQPDRLLLGGSVGYDWSRVRGATAAFDGATNGYTESESAYLDPEGVSYGVQAGYNYQFRNGIVAGFEAELSRPSLSGTQYSYATEGANIVDHLQSMTHYDYDWSAGIKGKLGYSFGNVLLYGSAGLALLHEKESRSQYQSFNANINRPEGLSTIWSFSERDEKLRTGCCLVAASIYAERPVVAAGGYGYTRFGRRRSNSQMPAKAHRRRAGAYGAAAAVSCHNAMGFRRLSSGEYRGHEQER